MKKAIRLVIVMGAAIAIQPAFAGSAFETYGDIGQFAIPAIAAGISWYNDDYEGLKQFGYSLAATEGTVLILKNTVDATRPNGSSKSFPSGHTAIAFSGASYLHMRYGWEYGLPAYIAAGAVGWSRVDAEQHYWRDVIAGAAIATGFSYLFTTKSNQQLTFYPTIMSDGAQGVALNYRY